MIVVGLCKGVHSELCPLKHLTEDSSTFLGK